MYGKDTSAAARSAEKAALNVQDAHEAIRPTDVSRTPNSVSSTSRATS